MQFSNRVKKEAFGDYMIDFFGLRPLLEINTNLADMYLFLYADRTIPSGWCYEMELAHHYKGVFPYKYDEDGEEITRDELGALGYHWVSNEQCECYYAWDVELPHWMDCTDVGDEY